MTHQGLKPHEHFLIRFEEANLNFMVALLNFSKEYLDKKFGKGKTEIFMKAGGILFYIHKDDKKRVPAKSRKKSVQE